jgi:hypothetical protein
MPILAHIRGAPPVALLLLAVAAPAAAQAGASGLKPATPADIAGATSACLAAVQPTGTDEAALLARGWVKATMTAEGRTVAAPLNIYGRKDANVIVMTAPGTGASGLCTATARVDSIDSFAAVSQEIGAALNLQPAKTQPGEIFWFAGRKVVQLAQTGDGEKPAVRVSVLHLAEKSE